MESQTPLAKPFGIRFSEEMENYIDSQARRLEMTRSAFIRHAVTVHFSKMYLAHPEDQDLRQLHTALFAEQLAAHDVPKKNPLTRSPCSAPPKHASDPADDIWRQIAEASEPSRRQLGEMDEKMKAEIAMTRHRLGYHD